MPVLPGIHWSARTSGTLAPSARRSAAPPRRLPRRPACHDPVMRSVPRIEFARERLQAGILVDAPQPVTSAQGGTRLHRPGRESGCRAELTILMKP